MLRPPRDNEIQGPPINFNEMPEVDFDASLAQLPVPGNVIMAQGTGPGTTMSNFDFMMNDTDMNQINLLPSWTPPATNGSSVVDNKAFG
jgi:hypothetical protein